MKYFHPIDIIWISLSVISFVYNATLILNVPCNKNPMKMPVYLQKSNLLSLSH